MGGPQTNCSRATKTTLFHRKHVLFGMNVNDLCEADSAPLLLMRLRYRVHTVSLSIDLCQRVKTDLSCR